MFLKCIKNPKSLFFSKKKKGFSFLEVMISIFIFSLMMTTISMTFANLFKNYQNTKAIQRNLENSQFAINLMAKSLRTSSVVLSTVSSIRFFNYSDGKCTLYNFSGISGTALQTASAAAPPSKLTLEDKKAWCGVDYVPIYINATASNINNVFFDVVPSSLSPKVMGKVTILMEVCANATCSGTGIDKIQSSVSLRDYNTVGL